MHQMLNANGTKNIFGTLEPSVPILLQAGVPDQEKKNSGENHQQVDTPARVAVGEIDLVYTTMERLSFVKKSRMGNREQSMRTAPPQQANAYLSSYDVTMARFIGVVNWGAKDLSQDRSRELYHRLFSVLKSMHYPLNMPNVSRLAQEALNVRWFNELATIPEYCRNRTKNMHDGMHSLLGIGTYDLHMRPLPFATRYSNLLISYANLTELGMVNEVERLSHIAPTLHNNTADGTTVASAFGDVELQSMVLYSEFKGDPQIHSQIIKAWCPNCAHSVQFPGCDRLTLLKSGHVVWERFMNAHLGGFFPMPLLHLTSAKSRMIETYRVEFERVRELVNNDQLNHHEWIEAPMEDNQVTGQP